MIHKGLTDDQVNESRQAYGANIRTKSDSGNLRILLEVIKEPMVLILVVACFFYFFMNEYQEGIIMAIAIVIVSGISIYQQVRSENAVKALNKLTQQLTTVFRNNEEIQIPSEELVVGDLAIYTEGQQVSADAEIIEFNDLAVDESILTGEAFAVQKSAIGEQIFSGTTITSGMAKVSVIAVGDKTRIGKLGKSMEEIVKETTPLQKQISNFVKRMALVGIVAFAFVWGYNYLQSGDVIQSLMHGLTLAMAVLPEEIPVALSTFMALGAYRMIKNNVLAKQPQTVEALGTATVICVDKTGTITENKMSVSEIWDFKTKVLNAEPSETKIDSEKELIKIAMLASEDIPFDPMEKAIHYCFNKMDVEKENFTMIREYPLSGIHPRMTHVYNNSKGKRIIACKGAPEGIINSAGLNPEEIHNIQLQLKEMASRGNRVLAIGVGIYDNNSLPDNQEEFTFEFLGLLALSDPPRKNIPEIIKKFYQSGIHVKMITGDFPETAISIAKSIGLKNPQNCVTGKQVSEMNEEELKKVLTNTYVFARVMPEIKLKIVTTLKSMGEVVAMTGDGVNDGPALKAAHIGIAMGKRGSEVARKAASLVLIDDDLSGMVKAVEFGRTIYSNLKRAIQYIISIHIPLISIVTIPLLLGWKFPNIFSPVHVIFLELIMGPTCSIAYENEPMEKGLMNRPPRKMTDSLFTWRELSRSLLQGAMLTAGLMILFYMVVRGGHSETTTRTMIFTTLVFANILLTLAGRSLTDPIYKTITYQNNLIPIVIGITLVLLILSIFWSPAMRIFEFENLSSIQILICAGMAAVSVLWIDLFKLFTTKQ